MKNEDFYCWNCGHVFEAEGYLPGKSWTRTCPNEAQHGNKLTIEAAVRLIKKSMGRFFTIAFTKRSTGERRVMTCRLGVHKHLKGGKKAYDPEKLGLMIVWEPKSAEYRSIPTDAITELRLAGRKYQVVK
jgi:hypothetical protein